MPRSSSDRSPSPRGSWTFEICAITFSIACLLALVILLIYAEGKETLVWRGITLNTLVSLLATMSKLSALSALGSAIAQSKWNLFANDTRYLIDFEAISLASQGAWGSVQLLCRTRRVAFVGALAFLIALAFDPFAQQLIQYRNEVVFKADSNTTLPIAHRYSRGHWRVKHMEIDAGGLPSVAATPDFPLQAAIWNGLSQSSSTILQQLPLACHSGNCTWPSFDTLAVCSTCNNVSSLVKERSTTGAVPLAALYDTEASILRVNMTHYTLPNGLFIDRSVGLVTSVTESPSRTLTLKTLDTLIWSVSSIKLTIGSSNDTLWRYYDTPLQADECGLYYCVRTIDSNITNNRPWESSYENTRVVRSPSSWRPQHNNTDTIYDLAFSDNASIAMTDLIMGNNYSLSQAAINSIGSFLNDMFIYGNASDPSGLPSFPSGFCDNTSTQECTPIATKAIWSSDNMTELFSTLALSMTNAIRVGSDHGLFLQGKSGIMTTTYRVQWPWIALPVAVLMASITQLSLTILSSRGKPLWKNSTLATMSRGKYVAEVLDGLQTTREMEKAASRRKVDLFTLKQHAKHPSVDSVPSMGNGSATHSFLGPHEPISPLLNWRPGESVPAGDH